MSDSFADLWNSSAPTTTKPAEAPRKLGAYTSSSTLTAQKPANDVFSMLAAAGPPSSSNSRSVTPSYSNGSQTPRTTQPPYVPKQPIQKAASSNGGDAFSGLLSGTLQSTSANTASLTMAERAALADKQRSAQLLGKQSAASKQSDSAWAGLDALGSGTSSLLKSNSTQAQSQTTNDDWDFGFEPVKPTPSPTITAKPQSQAADEGDDWLSEFATAKPTRPAAPARKPTSSSLFDELDDFSSAPPQSKTRESPEPPPRSRSPGDFDFGDREDGLLNGQSDDDDILGDLSKPVEQVRQRTATPSQSRSGPTSRAPSPPPHVLGRIVEMGFSIEQARVALAATDTGLNVEAALETLLANGAADSDRPSSRGPPPRSREPTREPREPPRRAPEEGRRRVPPSRPSRDTPSPEAGDTQRNIQEQADKILAQASEIGLNMFNRANAFWKEGKERVQKAYEERQKAAGASAGPARNGRPKWMQDAEEHDEELEAEWRAHKQRGGFKDDHDVLKEEAPPSRSAPQERRPKPQAKELQPQASSSRTENLLSDDTPSVYVSPWRRKTPSRTQTPAAASPSAGTPPKAPTPRAPSPIQLVQRKTISATPSALSASAKHKAVGTEKFKLGQYGEAEKAYSNAIDALPPSHLLLIPLYNNRALTRIKTGDHTGAVEDCTTVLKMIGASYHPTREAKVTKEDEGASVDIADAYVKAFKRRAEAYEGKEKWDLAKADWEVIAGTEWAKGNLRNEAVSGVGRCRRMVNANSGQASAPAPPAPRPKPVQAKPRPAPKVVVKDSEALNRVREANQAAEAEDEERHQLKDVVDTKLMAWKGGKETNIRALIASLENVLWPELGWQKVGMHELVTPNQVKIRYTKAIAKLHPDKLNVRNTTLEQRMIANGVFGSLNDAWNAFKQ